METRESATQKTKCKRRIAFSQRKKSQYNPERKFNRNSDNSKNENQSIGDYTKGSSSEQERKVNALASGADEGRDKLR